MPSPLLAAKKSVKSCQRGVSTTGARRPPPTGSAKNPLRGSLMRPCRLPIHLPFRVTPYVIPRKILDTPMSHTHMQSVCKYRLYIYIQIQIMISRHHLDFFSYGKISKSLNLRSRFPINSPAERSKAAGSKPSSQLSPPGVSKTVGDGSSHFLIGFFHI